MALIKCPECRKEISDKARECPHCGYPLGAGEFKKVYSESRGLAVASLIVLVVLGLVLLYFFYASS